MTGQSPRWAPSADLATLRLRAAVARDLREWFHEAGVVEVDTPAMSAAATTDPALDSFSVRGSPGNWWLHTSPEFPMKRLLAAGSGDIFQLCHVFRKGEVGARHNPEFSMLEWYRVDMDMDGMMDDVESLVRALCAGRRQLGSSLRLTYREALRQHAGVDAFEDGPEALSDVLQSRGVPLPVGGTAARQVLLDLLMCTVVEPSLDPERPVFVYDFPPWQAALARLRPGDPVVAERFELFLGGMELANGFHELADPDEQRARFERDIERRVSAGLESPPAEWRLVEALQAGLPECSGVALGFDRLLMFLADAGNIGEVLSFDVSRA
jgi:lysyl-tRNA synthetase class 2